MSKIVFTAFARENFYLREYITKFVLEKNHTPLSAFMMFSYFLMDSIERQRLIEANNSLVKISDEVWVFGKISPGVAEEIALAKSLSLKVKYFSIVALNDISSEIRFEETEICENLER
ncbi:MAG: hypothetical protein UX26_C0009G0006 [Parcubacteria group bacterium GW2011_GWC1_45_9]|nr:MAG: hypothetical protein UW85_C0010G0010 [Parcubacteria group bacterium GW2011_GWA1_Parcubacteria_45_10]KKT88601.1 MAG: hypothetical protein UW89_C0006G0009 [Parcubacteria group bacterium GW2011_GWB1_45_10]KKU17041.1 MAG: hypothetical protein UX26_C0009G0006 [Parcubacteria group bacterium GW2011_GWC1_45_9]HCI05226.1 hypothetical protein [Patescibacteria group bacterium]